MTDNNSDLPINTSYITVPPNPPDSPPPPPPPRLPDSQGGGGRGPYFKRNLQAAIMATIVIVCLVIFTFVATQAMRAAANSNDTTEQTSQQTTNPQSQQSNATSESQTTGNTTTAPTTSSYVTTASQTTPATTTPITTASVTTVPVTTTAPEPFDFEEQYWGAKQSEITAKERNTFVKKESTYLIYNGKYQNYAAQIIYRLDENGKLWRGEYLFTDKYSKEAGKNYLSQYDKIRAVITTTFGTGVEEQKHTCSKEDLYVIGQAQALEYGYSTYTVIWENEKTKVELFLISSQSDGITLSIRFTQK